MLLIHVMFIVIFRFWDKFWYPVNGLDQVCKYVCDPTASDKSLPVAAGDDAEVSLRDLEYIA